MRSATPAAKIRMPLTSFVILQVRVEQSCSTELAQSVRFWDGSRMDEYDNWDRSYRLLRAAASNGTVEPVPADRAEFLQEVWSLEGSPPATRLGRILVASQPLLAELEAEIRSGSPTQDRLEGRLRSLVGPSAMDAPAPIVATRTALTTAEKHLGAVFLNSRPDAPT